jgi:hypothetical protein
MHTFDPFSSGLDYRDQSAGDTNWQARASHNGYPLAPADCRLQHSVSVSTSGLFKVMDTGINVVAEHAARATSASASPSVDQDDALFESIVSGCLSIPPMDHDDMMCTDMDVIMMSIRIGGVPGVTSLPPAWPMCADSRLGAEAEAQLEVSATTGSVTNHTMTLENRLGAIPVTVLIPLAVHTGNSLAATGTPMTLYPLVPPPLVASVPLLQAAIINQAIRVTGVTLPVVPSDGTAVSDLATALFRLNRDPLACAPPTNGTMSSLLPSKTAALPTRHELTRMLCRSFSPDLLSLSPQAFSALNPASDDDTNFRIMTESPFCFEVQYSLGPDLEDVELQELNDLLNLSPHCAPENGDASKLPLRAAQDRPTAMMITGGCLTVTTPSPSLLSALFAPTPPVAALEPPVLAKTAVLLPLRWTMPVPMAPILVPAAQPLAIRSSVQPLAEPATASVSEVCTCLDHLLIVLLHTNDIT